MHTFHRWSVLIRILVVFQITIQPEQNSISFFPQRNLKYYSTILSPVKVRLKTSLKNNNEQPLVLRPEGVLHLHVFVVRRQEARFPVCSRVPFHSLHIYSSYLTTYTFLALTTKLQSFINKSVLFNISNTPQTESEFIVLPKLLDSQKIQDHIREPSIPVLFGSEICLKHVDSGYFVAGSSDTLQKLDGFKVRMTETYSRDCVFKFLPLRTFQHQGDKIFESSVFIIRNFKHKCYLNIQQDDGKPLPLRRNPSFKGLIPSDTPKLTSTTSSKNHHHPLLSETENLTECKLSYDKSKGWKFTSLNNKDKILAKERQYLQPNDLVYFIHSEDNSILSTDRTHTEIQFKLRNYSDFEIYNSLWEVEFNQKGKSQLLSLRHVVSGKYFSQNLSSSKTKITLKALLTPQNRLPPFTISVNDQKFQRTGSSDNSLHGFQISKADRKIVREIQSIKGMSEEIWVPYMIEFLKTDQSAKQDLLRQFGLLKELLELVKRTRSQGQNLLPPSLSHIESQDDYMQEEKRFLQRKEIYYKVIYQTVVGNLMNKRICCETDNVDLILKDPNKQLTKDLIIELLRENYDETEDVIAREILPEVIKGFMEEQVVSAKPLDESYMKILRSFTGTYRKANEQNQKVIFNAYYYIGDQPEMTETKRGKIAPMPLRFKTRLVYLEDRTIGFDIYIAGDEKPQPTSIHAISQELIQYYRQYLYLLADCMKQRASDNIRIFQNQFPLEMLCQALKQPSYEIFRGPLMNLIKTAYIDYDPHLKTRICYYGSSTENFYKGGLITTLEEGSKLFFVIKFISQQIQAQREYWMSYNLILLETLKLSMEFGFWKNIDDLLKIKPKLLDIIFYEPDKSRADPEEKRKLDNIELCKIMAVEIFRLLLNMQLSLWASQVDDPHNQNEISQKIDTWLEGDGSQWQLDTRFFILASSKNPELMQSSLQLFYRLFDIRKQLYQVLAETEIEKNIARNDQREFWDLVSKGKLDDQKNLSKILMMLIESSEGENMSPDRIVEKSIASLESYFHNKKLRKGFQKISIKLGMLERITQELARYNPRQLKSKYYATISLLMLIASAVLKDNSARTFNARERRQIVKYLAVPGLINPTLQMLECLYKNNKKLLTDHREIEFISAKLLETSIEQSTPTILSARIFSLLESFLTLRSKQIQVNQSIILNQLFKKELTQKLFKKPGQDELYFKKTTSPTAETQVSDGLYIVCLYSLFELLKQQIFKQKLTTIFGDSYKLLITLLDHYPTNWNVRAKIRFFYNSSIPTPQQSPLPQIPSTSSGRKSTDSSISGATPRYKNSSVNFLLPQQAQLKSDLNLKMLESAYQDLNYAYNNLSDSASYQLWMITDFEPNFKQILKTFKESFRLMVQKSSKVSSAKMMSQTIAQNELLIKVFERCFLLKDYASDILSQQVGRIAEKVRKTINKVQIKSQDPNGQFLLKIIESLGYLNEPNSKNSLKSGQKNSERKDDRKRKRSEIQMRSTQKKPINTYSSIHELKPEGGSSGLGFSNHHPQALQHIHTGILARFVKNVVQINEKNSTLLADDIKEFIVNFLAESIQSSLIKAAGLKQEQEFWCVELTRDQMQVVRKRQQAFKSLKIPSLVCGLVEETFNQRYKLFNGVLELAISVLLTGNTQFQNQFLEVFKADKKNTIFANTSSMIQETLNNIQFFYKYERIKNLQQYELELEDADINSYREERRNSCGLIWKAFRYLQLLCENNHRQMKNYMHSQVDKEEQIKYTSINFIDEANKTFWSILDVLRDNLQLIVSAPSEDKFIENLKHEIEDNLCVIPIFILDFLIEICQIPSEQNQSYLCRTNFFEVIKKLSDIIRSLDSKKARFTDTIKLTHRSQPVSVFFLIQKKLIILIQSLLESNDAFINQKLCSSISQDSFEFLLKEAFRYCGLVDLAKLTKLLQKEQMEPELLNVISVLIIGKSLGKSLDFKQKPTTNTSMTQSVVGNQSLMTLSRLSRDNQVVLAYSNEDFHYPEEKQLRQMVKTLEARVRSIEVDLLDRTLTVYFPYHKVFQYLSSETKEEIVYKFFESRTEKLKEMIGRREQIYEEINYKFKVHDRLINQKTIRGLFQMGMYLSFFILGLIMIFYSVTGMQLTLDILERKVIFSLSSMQFVLALLYFIIWGMHEVPLIQSRLKKKKLKVARADDNAKSVSLMDRISDNWKGIGWGQLIWKVYVQGDQTPLAFLVLSGMGVLLDPRWYGFNLLFLFADLSVLKNIFAAIRTNGWQFFIVCLFALVFTFSFSLLTLNSYMAPLYENEEVDMDISKGTKHCDTVLTCIISLYTQHIIGEGTPSADNNNYSRFIFDLLFVAFFSIFFNNILAGIMIDKFAELRDNREKIDNEIKSKCYICSTDKATLEKRNEDFDKHLEVRHNIWNYYFYMYSLERIKNTNDFTGIEYLIADMVEKEDIDFFPKGREDEGGSEKGEVPARRNEELERRLKQLEAKIQDFSQKHNISGVEA